MFVSRNQRVRKNHNKSKHVISEYYVQILCNNISKYKINSDENKEKIKPETIIHYRSL
jgi:hypothetical protein